MADPLPPIDIKKLRRLIPFNALLPHHFKKVIEASTIVSYEAGEELFTEGESDKSAFYLLEGRIDLTSGGKSVETIEAGTFPARHPLANTRPRKFSAHTKTSVRVLRAEANLLDILLTWGQSTRTEIENLDEVAGEDWLARMMQLTLFQKLPPENLKQVIERMEPISYSVGDKVIEQGGEGKYYYVIRQGRCEVTRRPSPDADEVKLAELSEGDSFGEEALVSGGNRNATVTMLTDGTVMRLAKGDFLTLIKQPLHIEVDYYNAEDMVNRGGKWLDVRLPPEHRNAHFEDDINIPLQALRLQVEKLKRDRAYICYCDTGRRSSVAAFLMRELGYEAYMLGGGTGNLPHGVFLSASIPEEEDLEHSLTLIAPRDLLHGSRPGGHLPRPSTGKDSDMLATAKNAALSKAIEEAETIISEAKEEAARAKKRATEFRTLARKEAEGMRNRAKSDAGKLLTQAKGVVQRAQKQIASAKKFLAEKQQMQQRLEQFRLQLTESMQQRQTVIDERDEALAAAETISAELNSSRRTILLWRVVGIGSALLSIALLLVAMALPDLLLGIFGHSVAPISPSLPPGSTPG